MPTDEEIRAAIAILWLAADRGILPERCFGDVARLKSGHTESLRDRGLDSIYGRE